MSEHLEPTSVSHYIDIIKSSDEYLAAMLKVDDVKALEVLTRDLLFSTSAIREDAAGVYFYARYSTEIEVQAMSNLELGLWDKEKVAKAGSGSRGIWPYHTGPAGFVAAMMHVMNHTGRDTFRVESNVDDRKRR